MPELEPENEILLGVYYRVFGSIENMDIFKVMDLVGIKTDDRLYCLDLIQNVRGEVMKHEQLKRAKQ